MIPSPTPIAAREALQWLSTEEMIVCQFCGYEFDERCGIYGCPNCEGEGLEDETPENAKSTKLNYFQPSIAEPKTGNAPQTTQNPPIEKPIWYNGVAMKALLTKREAEFIASEVGCYFGDSEDDDPKREAIMDKVKASRVEETPLTLTREEWEIVDYDVGNALSILIDECEDGEGASEKRTARSVLKKADATLSVEGPTY